MDRYDVIIAHTHDRTHWYTHHSMITLTIISYFADYNNKLPAAAQLHHLAVRKWLAKYFQQQSEELRDKH